MNNTFDFTRFGKLFLKHTIENYKRYLMATGVLCGVITLLYSFYFFEGNFKIDYKVRVMVFIFMYISAGVVFTSTVFTDYGVKTKSIFSLLLPASHFEKFLLAWLYSLLIYTVVFLACFYAIELLFLNVGKYPNGSKKILSFFSHSGKLYYALIAYIFLHSVLIYGAIAFKKLQFLKTSIVFFLIIIGWFTINHQFLRALIPEDIRFSPPLIDVSFKTSITRYHSIRVEEYYTQFLLSTVPVILWTAAFFRLKEKQV